MAVLYPSDDILKIESNGPNFSNRVLNERADGFLKVRVASEISLSRSPSLSSFSMVNGFKSSSLKVFGGTGRDPIWGY